MLAVALVFLGAGAGGVLRFAAHTLLQNWWGPSFPIGTLIVNVSGCFAIGILMAMWAAPAAIREEYRLAIMVGVLGGYTTFSSFGRETFDLVQRGHSGRAIAYVAASVAISLVAVWIGVAVGRHFGAGAGSEPH